MTTAERLLARLRESGLDLPDGSRAVRTHASRADRNVGAWTWRVEGPDGMPLGVGSAETMTSLLHAASWVFVTEWGETNVSAGRLSGDPGARVGTRRERDFGGASS